MRKSTIEYEITTLLFPLTVKVSIVKPPISSH
jgi:hypothetical protein